MTSDKDDTAPVVEQAPVRRTASDDRPAPRGRSQTAPIESVGGPGPAGGWAPHRTDSRSLPETAEVLRPVHAAGIAPPLGGDDFDGAIEADGAAERTMGFDEAGSTLDDDQRAELQAAVARSMAAERRGMGAVLDAADPTGTVDFDEGVAHRYRDVPVLGGPEATVDFADSLDASLDRAIDDVSLEDNPTDVDFPRPDTRPLGGMDPPEWAAHVLKACRSLEAVHEDERTFEGRFDLDEDGVVGEPRSAAAGTDGFVLDVRRMHHLIGVIAEAVRAGSDNSPTSMVVADALTEVKPAESAVALTRGLIRALAARTTRQHKRLVAEFEAVDARRRALVTQRRLRADLAARMARLDASISAQAAAVARDEDRVQMLNQERKILDGLVELAELDGDSLDESPRDPQGRRAEAEEARNGSGRSTDEARGDKVRRLLGA